MAGTSPSSRAERRRRRRTPCSPSTIVYTPEVDSPDDVRSKNGQRPSARMRTIDGTVPNSNWSRYYHERWHRAQGGQLG